VADPPLMRLETEAGHAYLSVLVHMAALLQQGKHVPEECQVRLAGADARLHLHRAAQGRAAAALHAGLRPGRARPRLAAHIAPALRPRPRGPGAESAAAGWP
jgi:hypothetical protein